MSQQPQGQNPQQSAGSNGNVKASLRDLFAPRGGKRPSLLAALWGTFGNLTMLLVLAVLGFAGYEVYRSVTAQREVVRREEQTAALVPTVQPPASVSLAHSASDTGGTRSAEESTTRSIIEGRAALARVKRDELLDEAAEAGKRLDEWIAELDRFDHRVAELLDGEDGKALAASSSLVPRFIAIAERERNGKDAAEKLRARLATLVEPVQAAHRRTLDSSVPGEDISKQVRVIATSARTERDDLRAALAQLDGIVSSAKRAGTTGTERLRDAVAAEKLARADREAAAIEAAVRDARERGVKKLADERARAETAALESEAAKVRQDAAVKKAEADRLLAEQRAVEEKDARKAELTKRMTDVKRYLTPFTAAGHTQPKTTHEWEKGQPKGPVSLSRLDSIGCLKNTADGLEKLALVGCREVSHNDRERWSFYPFRHSWDAETTEFLRAAQALLREHGRALVEAGMLAE